MKAFIGQVGRERWADRVAVFASEYSDRAIASWIARRQAKVVRVWSTFRSELRSAPCGIVVTQRLSGPPGLAAFQTLRIDYPTVPWILILEAPANLANLRQIATTGADIVLQTPLNPTDLDAAIEELLRCGLRTRLISAIGQINYLDSDIRLPLVSLLQDRSAQAPGFWRSAHPRTRIDWAQTAHLSVSTLERRLRAPFREVGFGLLDIINFNIYLHACESAPHARTFPALGAVVGVSGRRLQVVATRLMTRHIASPRVVHPEELAGAFLAVIRQLSSEPPAVQRHDTI